LNHPNKSKNEGGFIITIKINRESIEVFGKRKPLAFYIIKVLSDSDTDVRAFILGGKSKVVAVR
jgi:hypothetical protein